jgi:ferredoxin--NADP+ reductase
MSEFAARAVHPDNKRIVLRFDSVPTEIIGVSQATGVRVRAGDDEQVIDSPLILRSIGYVGEAIPGLPFDHDAGVVPNDHGRVVGTNGAEPGVYVTGWIKRGARGVIGTNRQCARETVGKLWQDFDEGLLSLDVTAKSGVGELLAQRGVEPIDTVGWRAIDAAERLRGREVERPRVKFVDIAEMLVTARG